ncbi:MAG: hydrogenase expression/formation protein HypE, partial [Endomicrobiia bacterium]
MQENKILLSHGSGGKLTHELIEKLFKGKFNNEILNLLDDSAVFQIDSGQRLAFTTDSFVVKPIFFPGGDIGKLAVCGTINDLAVCGAKPLFISCSAIIEEGFSIDKLEKIVESIRQTAKMAGVKIVTGDTKVVEKGSCDEIFINTSGIGIVPDGINLSIEKIKPGDKILINGPIAEHGISIIKSRERLDFKAEIKSDCAPLNELCISISSKVKFMRDPTRGGVSAVLNEIVSGRNFGIKIYEERIPVRKNVKTFCDILGFDPLYVGNEGKVIVIVEEKNVQQVLKTMKKNKYGKNSCVIGEVVH